jgi:hypothetical protein
MPMGKLLHCISGSLYIFTFFLFISIFADNELYAQLKFENLQSYELEIAEVSDLANRNYWKLDPSDYELSRLFGIGLLRTNENEPGYYRILRPEGYYVAYQPGDENSYELIRFHFENNSGRIIDRIQVGFDLSVQLQPNSDTDLILNFDYGTISGSELLLNGNQFRSNRNQLQRTSLNTVIENILLEPGETIEFSVNVTSPQTLSATDTIALQRIEISPEESLLSNNPNEADLVISEIFAGTYTESDPLYYLEIYNSTLDTIDLRGLTIKSGDDNFRIRQSVEIEPYSWIVIANRNFEQIGFTPDVIIENLRLPSHGGMIELVQGGNRIMRAAFDTHPGDRAWELQSVNDVMDGYASMNQFAASENQFSGDLFGSPGYSGATERIFAYEVRNDTDWMFISPPGALSIDLQNHDRYWPGIETDNAGRIPRGFGMLIRNERATDATERWIARESDQASIIRLDLREESNKWVLLGNPFEQKISLMQVIPENGEFEGVNAQIWNNELKTFTILEPGSEIEPWQAFLIKNRNAESVVYQREYNASSGNRSFVDARSRAIHFELQLTESRQEPLTDLAAVLYFHENAAHGADSFDSEKLWPLFKKENQERSSLLYFTGRGSQGNNFLAQDARPFQVNEPFEVTMGHIAYNVSGQHTLSWNGLENIPDSWQVTLTDLRTGQVLDMREEHQLTFDATVNIRTGPELSEEPGIHPVQLSETYERFKVSINPDPSQMRQQSESDTRPDRIELYQNYPNPFNPATNIRFYLPDQQPVVIGIYNVVGQRVAQLVDDVMPQGEHTVMWDATEMPSGIYIVHLEMGSRVLTRKMTLIK